MSTPPAPGIAPGTAPAPGITPGITFASHAAASGVLKRAKITAPLIAYCCMLLVLAGMAMAQTNILPPSSSSIQDRLSQAVTGHEVVAYLQEIHGQDVANDARYAQIIQRMTALGDKPVNTLNWSAITGQADASQATTENAADMN